MESLGYPRRAGLVRATDMPESSFCLPCSTGNYPIPVQRSLDKLGLEAFVARPAQMPSPEPVLVGAGAEQGG